jgi:DNA-binding HxlR family transcriptional regulator
MFFGSTRYSEIQKYIPNISPSLLRDRLRFLQQQGVIMRKRAASGNRYEYQLTSAGKSLAPVLTKMGKWGFRWASDHMSEKQNTATGLVRDFAGRINVDELPSGNTAIASGRVKVDAAPDLSRRIGRWLRISSFTTDHPRIVPCNAKHPGS